MIYGLKDIRHKTEDGGGVMIRLKKKDINKLCIVSWEDAKGDYNVTLDDFLKEGFIINLSVGFLMYYDSKKIILASEISKSSKNCDLCMIPSGWVKEIKWLKES